MHRFFILLCLSIFCGYGFGWDVWPIKFGDKVTIVFFPISNEDNEYLLRNIEGMHGAGLQRQELLGSDGQKRNAYLAGHQNVSCYPVIRLDQFIYNNLGTIAWDIAYATRQNRHYIQIFPTTPNAIHHADLWARQGLIECVISYSFQGNLNVSYFVAVKHKYGPVGAIEDQWSQVAQYKLPNIWGLNNTARQTVNAVSPASEQPQIQWGEVCAASDSDRKWYDPLGVNTAGWSTSDKLPLLWGETVEHQYQPPDSLMYSEVDHKDSFYLGDSDDSGIVVDGTVSRTEKNICSSEDALLKGEEICETSNCKNYNCNKIHIRNYYTDHYLNLKKQCTVDPCIYKGRESRSRK